MFAIYYTKMNCFFHSTPGLNPWQAYKQPCHVPFPAGFSPLNGCLQCYVRTDNKRFVI
jgi:hypothetical protein